MHERGLGGVLAAILTRTDDPGQLARELAQWKQHADQSGIDFGAALEVARHKIQNGYRAPRDRD